MRRMLFVAYLMLACAAAMSGQVRRLALVLGNDSYPGNELKNARNDAKAIASAFGSLGYITTLKLDTNRREMIDEIDRFAGSLHPGDLVVFYYAGHGLQVEGENYLVPTDFITATPHDVPFEAYSLSTLLRKLTDVGATTQIVILDACRNSPFLSARSVSGGWAITPTSAGTILAFGTSPGSTASDDPSDGHGLFTKMLLRHLTSSHSDFEDMLKQVRIDVIASSNGQQVPWVSSSLIGTVHALPSLDTISGNNDSELISRLANLTLKRRDESDPSRFEDMRQLHDSGNPSNPQQPELEGSIDSSLERAALSDRLTAASSVGNSQRNINLATIGTIALRILGIALGIAGRGPEAEQALDRAIAAGDNIGETYIERCLVSGALSYCEAGVQLQPSFEMGHLALASVLLDKNQCDRAYAEVSLAINIAPHNAIAYALRAAISERQGLHASAEADLALAKRLKAPEL